MIHVSGTFLRRTRLSSCRYIAQRPRRWASIASTLIIRASRLDGPAGKLHYWSAWFGQDSLIQMKYHRAHLDARDNIYKRNNRDPLLPRPHTLCVPVARRNALAPMAEFNIYKRNNRDPLQPRPHTLCVPVARRNALAPMAEFNIYKRNNRDPLQPRPHTLCVPVARRDALAPMAEFNIYKRNNRDPLLPRPHTLCVPVARRDASAPMAEFQHLIARSCVFNVCSTQ